MKINITKKEYRTLLEMVEIANWVLYAHKTEEEPEKKKSPQLRIYALCRRLADLRIPAYRMEDSI